MWVVFGLLVAALALVLVRQDRAGRRLRQELAILQRQKLELARLAREHRDLAAQQVSVEELERLRRDHAAMEPGQAHSVPVAGEAPAESATVVHPKLVAASDWRFAGQGTPKAAFESTLWAATHQDVDRLAGLLCFDTKTRADADAFFAQLPEETRAQYGTPEKIAATMLAATLPDNLSAMGALLDSANATTGDNAKLLMQVQRSDGTQKDSFFDFQRGPEGWQLVVPSDVLAAYQKLLTKSAKSLNNALSGARTP
jgi:hypothetical protein